MDINLLPPLYLIYADNPSDSGKVDILMDSNCTFPFLQSPVSTIFSFSHGLLACLYLHEFFFDRIIKLMHITSVKVLEKPNGILLFFPLYKIYCLEPAH